MSGLTVRHLHAALGAEISGINLAEPLDAATFGAVHQAWMEHLVLVFPGQALTDAQHIAFARRFGRLVTLYEHGTTVPGFPEIVRVSNVKEDGKPIGLAGAQELPWHHDHSYLDCPAKESFLEAVAIPSQSPRTSFLDMVAVLSSLPQSLRKRIAGLRAVHHIDERKDVDPDGKREFGVTGLTPEYRDSTNVLAQQRIAQQRALHPLVVRHPDSGLAALYASPLATHEIAGLSRSASQDLFAELFERAVQPEYIYAHSWSVGDLVVWDTITTLHHREAFDPRSRRLMKQMSTQSAGPLVAY